MHGTGLGPLVFLACCFSSTWSGPMSLSGPRRAHWVCLLSSVHRLLVTVSYKLSRGFCCAQWEGKGHPLHFRGNGSSSHVFLAQYHLIFLLVGILFLPFMLFVVFSSLFEKSLRLWRSPEQRTGSRLQIQATGCGLVSLEILPVIYYPRWMQDKPCISQG